MGSTSEEVSKEATDERLPCNVDILVIGIIVDIGVIVVFEELIVSEGLIIGDAVNIVIIDESLISMVDKALLDGSTGTSEDKGTVKVEFSANATLIMPLPIDKESSSTVVAEVLTMSKLIVSDVMV